MRCSVTTMLALALALAFACSGLSAIAAPLNGTGANGGALGMGALSDRYESLSELGNSLTDEESVVIATRIGVLVSANRALDNSAVSFEGEVVGDVVHASEGGYRWANLLGASNSVISVFMSDDQTRLIQNVGDYHTTGTMIKTTGVYHVACPEHQGELDVHATSVEVVDSGGPVTHLVSPGRMVMAFSLCLAAVLVLVLYLWVRDRARKRDEA